MVTASKIDVWVASCEDRCGAIMGKLEGLAKAGANLELILSHRSHEEHGKGVVFVTPLRGERQEEAARQLGFRKTQSLHSVRVEGADEPGLGYLIMRALAAESINIRGVTAAVQGGHFTMVFAFDSDHDADRAIIRLKRAL